MSSIDQAKKLMQAHLAELEKERRAIKSALAALEKGSAGAPPAPRRRSRRRRTKRAGRGERQIQFLDVVREHPGERITEIARKMGVKPQQLYPIARRLSDGGAIAKLDGGYTATAASPIAP